MSDLLERLRARGWRMTSQRRVVAEVLSGEHVHLTADEVHARAVERLPEIARATVYNTLGELVSLGEVVELSTDGRAKRYDPNARRPHQHLVCTECGCVRRQRRRKVFHRNALARRVRSAKETFHGPGERIVLAHHTSDGRELWARRFKAEKHGKHQLNSFASATPVVDAKRLYVGWGTPAEFIVLRISQDTRALEAELAAAGA